jgi:hypothetical protein
LTIVEVLANPIEPANRFFVRLKATPENGGTHRATGDSDRPA